MRQPAKWIVGEVYCKQGEKQGQKTEGRSMADVSKEQGDQGDWVKRGKELRRGIQMVRGARHLRIGK